MAGVRVIPLVCPDCGSGLAGLRFDKIFFCNSCMQGLAPAAEDGEWERFPVRFPELQKNSIEPSFFLPFWEFPVSGSGEPANKHQALSLKRLDEIRSVWVMGFNMIRASYFGDLGLLFTERGVALTPARELPDKAFVAGCSRTVEEAKKYVELYVTLILDKRADVTGLKLHLQAGAPVLWGVPFIPQGDKIAELILGAEVPVFAVDDLEDIRRIAGRR